MTSGCKILWADVARIDLEDIYDHIVQKNPARAIDIFRRIESSIDKLSDFPKQGRVVPELFAQGISNYREIIVSPWRILYRISHGTVYIIFVIDERRNLEDILLERLLRKQF